MDNKSEEKVPYSPSEARRFDLSHDEYSRERVKSLLTAYRTLKEELPFFAGLSVFGSLSKGKALTVETAQETDIDVFAFIDNDKYKETIYDFENTPEFQEFFQEYMKKPQYSAMDMERVRADNVRSATERFLEKRLKQLVSQGITNQPVDEEKVSVETGFIAIEDKPHSLYNHVAIRDEIAEAGRGLADIELAVDLPIAGAFFYDIGGGLTPYRKEFFKKLLSEPEEVAEKHWQTAVNAMKAWERKHNIPESIAQAYPPTLAEAVKYYTSNSSQ